MQISIRMVKKMFKLKKGKKQELRYRSGGNVKQNVGSIMI